MTNHSATKKSVRRTETRTAINKSRTSRIRTFLRKVEDAITSSDQATSLAALRKAESEIMRGVQKGVIKKNTASRKISRLSARIKNAGKSA